MTSTRILSTGIFAAFFLTAMYWPAVGFVVPLTGVAVAVWAALEYCALARARTGRPVVALSVTIAFALAAAGAWGGGADGVFLQRVALILMAALVACGVAVVLRNRTQESLSDLAVTFFGGCYAGLPLGVLLNMRESALSLETGNFLLLFTIAVTWIADGGAYFSGRAFGRRKLCPSLSPNKTIEGLAGGALATWLMALALRAAPLPGREILSWIDVLALATLFNLVGPLGDLTESILKRDAQVKDSGVNLTGHGGILDVIDSLLFTAPVAGLYLALAPILAGG